MGKKSKSKSTSEPTGYAKGYLTPALGAVQGAYGSVAPKADAISDTIYGQLPGLAESAFGDNPLVEAGQGYLGDVLGGKYLSAGNPYLDQIAATTRSNVADNINATFSKAGRTGSGANVAALGRGLSEAENALRYQAYGAERNAMAQAAGLIPSVNGAQYQGLGAYLGAAAAATGIPLQAAQGYASTIGGLVSPYSTQTTTQKQGLGSMLGQLGGAALSGWAMGGFK